MFNQKHVFAKHHNQHSTALLIEENLNKSLYCRLLLIESKNAIDSRITEKYLSRTSQMILIFLFEHVVH